MDWQRKGLYKQPYPTDYPSPVKSKDYNVHPEQLSFDHATTSNIYAAIQKLQDDVNEIKRSIAETPELLKDAIEQMHHVLSALDDLNDAVNK
jgi:uncharacterized coiled-coil DUF342 family protein